VLIDDTGRRHSDQHVPDTFVADYNRQLAQPRTLQMFTAAAAASERGRDRLLSVPNHPRFANRQCSRFSWFVPSSTK
jgi:hypothetical protein